MELRKAANRDEAVQLLSQAAASGLKRAVWARQNGINQVPDPPPDVGQIAVDPAQHAMILEGIDLSARRRLRYRRRDRTGDPGFNDRLPERIDKTTRG